MRPWEITRASAWKMGLALMMVVEAAACGGSMTSTDTPEAAVESALRPSSDLVWGCYEFPPADPTQTDRVSIVVSFASEDTAIDFTLKDTGGEVHRLADLLKTRPVVLIFGSFS